MTAKKKTATLPAIKKVSEKSQKEMVSRRSKLTEIVDNAMVDEKFEPEATPTKAEASKTVTASLPPATKKVATTSKATTSTTPAKGGKLELDDLLSGLGKKKAPEVKQPVDFRQYYK